jgi:hypothetical protein
MQLNCFNLEIYRTEAGILWVVEGFGTDTESRREPLQQVARGKMSYWANKQNRSSEGKLT